MRRRPHKAPLMEEPDIDADLDVESQDEDEPLIQSAFNIDMADDRKSLSLLPRSYSGRRRLYIVGFVLLTVIAWSQLRSSEGK